MALFGSFSGKQSKETKGVPHVSETEARLARAGQALKKGNPEEAFQIYLELARTCQNSTAQYNLGSLYARGLGCPRDLVEAACWYRRAEQNGAERTKPMVRKCELDEIRRVLKDSTPKDLVEHIRNFVVRVFPEEPADLLIPRELTTLGLHHFNQEDYSSAAKLFRASGEFCDDGQAQNFLGVLYNAGAGVNKSDLAALYWLDRAVDNGYEDARPDRDGILEGFRNVLTPAEFREYFELLARWCEAGTEDVAPWPRKSTYWREIARTGAAGK